MVEMVRQKVFIARNAGPRLLGWSSCKTAGRKERDETRVEKEKERKSWFIRTNESGKRQASDDGGLIKINTEKIEDQLKLVFDGGSGEERPAARHLEEDAPHSPGEKREERPVSPT